MADRVSKKSEMLLSKSPIDTRLQIQGNQQVLTSMLNKNTQDITDFARTNSEISLSQCFEENRSQSQNNLAMLITPTNLNNHG